MSNSETRTGVLLVVLCVLTVGFLSGCSRSDGRLAVSGKVTLDGKPLDSATIRFQPVDINKATGSGGMVRDGDYSVDAEHGLTAGKYAVTISASEKTGKKLSHPTKPRETIDEYREIRFQEAGRLEVTVDPKASPHFDFKLTRACP